MTLLEVLQQISDQTVGATQPTDLFVGTVTAVDPLEIQTDIYQAPLKKEVLLLTEAVIEKKIDLSHTHKISGLSHSHSAEVSIGQGLTGTYTTQNSLTDVPCYENGTALPIENGYVILNKALAVGDKVMMISVQHGQKFIVLSRLF